MSGDAAETKPDTVEERPKKKGWDMWNVRANLGSVEAMHRYDAYIKEHTRLLRQLRNEAEGHMAPSGEWYNER